MDETQGETGVGAGPALGRVVVDEWRGLYGDGWKGTISDSAFAHPAKFAKGLIFRIVQHALEEGFLKPGDTALDCFGGVGLGGLPCALQGIQHIAVELEPRFVALATGFDCGGANAKHECCPVTETEGLFGHGPHHVEGNLELWHRLYGAQPQWVQPRMLQGDSRNLKAVIEAADCIVSSPPYAGSFHGQDEQLSTAERIARTSTTTAGTTGRNSQINHPRGYSHSPHNLGNLPPGSVDACLSSPPYAGNEKSDYLLSTDGKTRRRDEKRGYKQGHGCFRGSETYGQTEGNLGAMETGEVAACISSPPYADRCANDDQRLIHRNGLVQGHNEADGATYGATPGQLSAMATGEVATCISSPPHGNSTPVDGRAITDAATHTRPLGSMDDLRHGYGESPAQLATMTTKGFAAAVSSPPFMQSTQVNTNPQDMTAGKALWKEGTDSAARVKQDYLEYSTENLGKAEPDTFWSAARTILEQVYALLKPGGVAIWVVKSYIRDRQIVDFPGQWRKLCEHVGFVTLHEHHALLVDSHSEMGLFGEKVEMYRKSSKSFFRRLAEKAGAPEINFETVFCMRKPWDGMPPDEAWQQLPLVDACCSSPPYAASDQNYAAGWARIDTTKGVHGRHTSQMEASYGHTTGQLSAMSPGELTAVISSPPYAQSVHDGNGIDPSKLTGNRPGKHTQAGAEGYGRTDGQLGAMSPGEPLGGEEGQ